MEAAGYREDQGKFAEFSRKLFDLFCRCGGSQLFDRAAAVCGRHLACLSQGCFDNDGTRRMDQRQMVLFKFSRNHVLKRIDGIIRGLQTRQRTESHVAG